MTILQLVARAKGDSGVTEVVDYYLQKTLKRFDSLLNSYAPRTEYQLRYTEMIPAR